MIAIVDYGVGNTESIRRALEVLGLRAVLTGDAATVRSARAVILPGVGAFDSAMATLERTGLAGTVRDALGLGRVVLGICLGMQVLFSSSEEGTRRGLGLLPGRVVRLPGGQRIPHLGWNLVCWDPPISPPSHFYFAHSYYAVAHPGHVLARTSYGTGFPAVVNAGCLWGVQFHPEKSGPTGLALLGDILEGRLAACC
ncbi:MAG: imidazole glycerol phosphate synthase subunit HisH [Bacillota bacterium]